MDKILYAVQLPPEDVVTPLSEYFTHIDDHTVCFDGTSAEGLVFYGAERYSDDSYTAYGHYDYLTMFKNAVGVAIDAIRRSEFTPSEFEYFDSIFKTHVSRDKIAWISAVKAYLYDTEACNRNTSGVSTNCLILSAVTGHPYTARSIHDGENNKYKHLYYPKDKFTEDDILNYESQYFQTGTQWIICENEPSKEGLKTQNDEIAGIAVYVKEGATDDDVKNAVRKISGTPDTEIVLYRYKGYIKTYLYDKVGA